MTRFLFIVLLFFPFSAFAFDGDSDGVAAATHSDYDNNPYADYGKDDDGDDDD